MSKTYTSPYKADELRIRKNTRKIAKLTKQLQAELSGEWL